MRIVHMTSVHVWNDVRIFRKMCRSLAGEGHEVHLVVCGRDPAETEEIDGVCVGSVPAAKGRTARMFRRVPAILAAARELDADLYHFHDPEFLPWAPSFQRRMSRPTVYDAHEDVRAQIAGKEWIAPSLRPLLARTAGGVEDYASRRLSGVVSATPAIAERFENHPRTALVRNFPLLEEFESETEERIERDPNLFVYVGEITAIRGIRETIEALTIAGSDVRLALAGPWEDLRYREELVQLPGWKQVEEMGALDRRAVRRILSRSAAGLVLFPPLPNHLRSRPTKLFEYMAAGLPVVASDMPDWKEIVEGRGCGIAANPNDPADIARALRRIVENPVESREFGARGRKAVEERYNWDREFPKLLNLYGEVIDTFGRRIR